MVQLEQRDIRTGLLCHLPMFVSKLKWSDFLVLIPYV